METNRYVAACDGGCSDGEGTAAYIVKNDAGETLFKGARRLPELTTNNRAEYFSAIDLLVALYASGLQGEVTVYNDSKLMVHQVDGSYKVKVAELKPLRANVIDLIQLLSENGLAVTFKRIGRENPLISEVDLLGRSV